MNRFDAVIVGAGPAGSSAAIFLARRGYSVALVEKRRFPREKLCGDFLNPANWECFEKLGIDAALLSLTHEKVGAFQMSAASTRVTIPFPSRRGRPSFGIGLRRSLFDDFLLRLAEKAGATVMEGLKPVHLNRVASGWALAAENSGGEEILYARLVIGADGRNSWVAHCLGVARPDESGGRFVGFQCHLKNCRGIDGEVEIHLFPGGYGGLVGLGDGTATLAFVIDKNIARENPAAEELWRKYLYQNFRLKEALEMSEIVGTARSAYPVYFSPRRSFGDGFLLAGDAARVTEPITGEGVYFALKSGELAAAAADSAFQRGDVSARALSYYAFACRKALGRRHALNRLIAVAMRHPRCVDLLLRAAKKNDLPLRTLVHAVCRTAA